MITTFVAIAMAFGSESVDGIFGKGRGSCTGGSCSAAPVETVAKAEPKAEAKAAPAESACASAQGSCGGQHRSHRLLGGRRGCR